MDENEKLEPIYDSNEETSSENNKSKVAEKATNKIREKATKEATKKASKTAAKTVSKISILGPILVYILIVIIVILILIGIIIFLVTMPGMAIEKAKDLIKNIGNKWLSFWGQDQAKQIDNKEIYGVLDYLEQMGYDLKGHGFLTSYVGTSDDGVERNEDDGTISNAESDFIFTYIVSENYLYTIKNTNVVTDWWKAPFEHLFALWSDDLENRKGMLAIFHEDNGRIGSTKENAYDAWERGSIKAYPDSKTLKIKRGWFTNSMSYNLDGWTGRYGKPLDFLLSVHIATMMPDLAYDIASNFPTEVYLILHKVNNAEVIASYKTDSGQYVDYPSIETALTGNEARNWASRMWDWFDNLNINVEEAKNVFELGVEHSSDCNCTFENGELKTLGSNCKKHIKEILDNLKDTNDYDFNTYTPYISKVTNHWFRDVYFIDDESQNLSFITNDSEYETLVKERWTLYETYSNDDRDKGTYKYDLDKAGEYILYEVDENGNYKTSGDGKKGYDGHIIYDGSQDDANEANIKVAKQAITKKIADIVDDANWNNIAGTWAAYEFEGVQTTSMERVFSDEQAEDNEIKKRIYFEMTTGGNVVQTGEGQRIETNPLIKKMFLQNTYFRYDGSSETAEAITKLRKNNNLKYGALNDKSLQGRSLDSILKLKTTVGEGEDKKEVTVEDVSGQVTLNQDSLNAFNILENEHTLDADYIYRDFKELIVELGYFTKEELTENTPRIMQFIVPDIGSYGYPKRVIDKRENEFGTMLHSKDDIEAIAKNTLRAAIEAAFNDDPGEIVNQTSVSGISSNSQQFVSLGAVREPSRTLLSLEEWEEKLDEMMQTFKDKGFQYSQDHTCTSFEQALSRQYYVVDCSLFASWALQELGVLSEGQSFSSHIADGGNVNGESPDVAEAILDAGAEIIEVNGAIGSEDKLEPGDVVFFKDNEGHVTIYFGEGCKCYDAGGAYWLTQKEPIDYPSVLTRECSIILRFPFGTSSSEGQTYEGLQGNEAVVSPVTGVLLDYGTYTDSNVDSVTNNKYRVNVDLQYGPPNTLEYDSRIVSDKVGYAKILLLDKENYKKLESASQTKWKNENGNQGLLNKDGNYEEGIKNTDELEDLSLAEKTIYGYKEFAELYEKYGISGSIIYIDGFKTELPDTQFTAGENSTEKPQGQALTKEDFAVKETELENDNDLIQTKYELDEEYQTISKKATSRLDAEAIVKNDAAPSIGLNGLIFIKEGTVLGRTYTDREIVEDLRNENYNDYRTGNNEDDKIIGNYLRIIMRDKDDTVVEDVENYMKLDEEGGETDRQECEFEQLAYFLGCLEEGFYSDMDLGDAYSVTVLADGAGNTTAFGLTNSVANLESVKSAYPSFGQNLANGSVPKKEAQDVFILTLESAKETIQNNLLTSALKEDDPNLFALIDLHHASPSECQKVVVEYNSRNNNLTADKLKSIYSEHWGTNPNYAKLLKRRGVNRGYLAAEGKFILYQEGLEGKEVIYETETPWTEFCENGGTFSMTQESSGLYHLEKNNDVVYPGG